MKKQEKIEPIIAKVSKVLSKKKNWTYGAWARDAEGLHVQNASPRAASHCLAGALNKVIPGEFDTTLETSIKFLHLAARRLFRHRTPRFVNIVTFNDHKKTTFQDVRKVIALAKKLAKDYDRKNA